MKTHLPVSLTLLLLACGPAIHSQSPTVNCSTDALAAGSEGCAQSQPSVLRGTSVSGAADSSQTAAGPAQRMTSSGSENTTLGGKDVVPLQQSALPPDAPTEFQQFVEATIGQPLSIFGADLFHNVPSTFSPSDLAPVTPDYVVGPEDELRVRIWGQVNYSDNPRVDRSGNIYLPQVGDVHVAGLPFAALDGHLRTAVGRVFRNFDLSVDIGRIRSMQIYVTGQARRPGVYTVSSLSSLVDALFASGGPSPRGSLRHIELHRNGKTVADFDLYALLVHGDKSKDARLLPEDVLYIPAAGSQVAIAGSIRNPAIYELRGGETIGDLIELAGKTTAMSSEARISLERLGQDQHRQAMEFAFDANGQATLLNDGDILRIYSILPAYQKTVALRGNVANPGRFSLLPGMRLSDLIPDRDSLVTRDYWWKRANLGLPVPAFDPIVQPAIPVPGQAATPGTIAAQLEQTTSTSSAGQPRKNGVNLSAPEIDWDYAVIERLDQQTLKTSLIPFDLGKLVLNHDASQDFALQPGDAITIFSQADIRIPVDQQTKYVDLEGEFVHAGVYSAQPGETLRDVVRRAGGFSPKAYLYGSELTRETTRVLQQQRIDEYVRNLSVEAERNAQLVAMSAAGNATDSAASRAAAQALVARLSQIRATGRIVLQMQPDSSSIDDVPAIGLENGDRFMVPFAPATINVVGAVYNQNAFIYETRRTVGRYLQLAGGPARNADWRRAYVIHADGSVVSRSSSNSYSVWSNSFGRLRLYPGDSIVVPEKIVRPSAMRNLLEWTQAISQIGFGAAAFNTIQ